MSNYQYSDFEDCGFFYSKTKKVRHIYQYVYDPDNIIHSIHLSQQGKSDSKAVISFNENYYENLDEIYWMLRNETYLPGPLRKRKIFERKERILNIPPYNPDRIIDICLVNVVEPILMETFILHTYSCIKGRGIHACLEDIVAAIARDPDGTRFALIMDIHKYYDNIYHERLKWKYRRKIGDPKMLRLMDLTVDCNGKDVGEPIGKRTSQMFGNYNLTDLEHFLLEVLHVHYLFVYMDNIVIFGKEKARLHYIFTRTAMFLATHEHLELNPNWQVFPLTSRDLDHVGYRISPEDVRLRKSILYRFFAKLERTRNKYDLQCEADIKHAYPSEYGWLEHCSEKHKEFIINKILKENEKKIHQSA